MIQHIWGVIILRTMESKKINRFTPKLSDYKKMHRIMGFILYILTKVSVLSGIWIYDYRDLLYFINKIYNNYLKITFFF